VLHLHLINGATAKAHYALPRHYSQRHALRPLIPGERSPETHGEGGCLDVFKKIYFLPLPEYKSWIIQVITYTLYYVIPVMDQFRCRGIQYKLL